MESARGEYKYGFGAFHMRYRVSAFPSLPVSWLASQPTFVFVTVNEAPRYFVSNPGTGKYNSKVTIYKTRVMNRLHVS
jgi:hypothetical protein